MQRIIRSAAPRRPARITRAVPAKTVRVLGIDASLTSTGWAYRAGGRVIAGHIPAKQLRGPERLAYIVEQLIQQEAFSVPTLVVLEDYAKGIGKGGRAFDIGELGGVIKTYFWNRGIDVMLVSPTALKKAITGRGNADQGRKINGKVVKDKTKPEMRAALLQSFGIELHQADAADACGLMLMGEMRCGSTTVARSQQAKLRLDSLRECVIIQGSQRKPIS